MVRVPYWASYLGYAIWPQFCGSAGPQGLKVVEGASFEL